MGADRKRMGLNQTGVGSNLDSALAFSCQSCELGQFLVVLRTHPNGNDADDPTSLGLGSRGRERAAGAAVSFAFTFSKQFFLRRRLLLLIGWGIQLVLNKILMAW